MKKIEDQKAYEEGKQAKESGASWLDNPYLQSGHEAVEHYYWNRGFSVGRRETSFQEEAEAFVESRLQLMEAGSAELF